MKLTCHIQVGGSGSANENHNTNKKYRTETLGYADNGLIVLENKPLPEEFNEIYRDAIEDYNRKVCEAGRPGRMKSLDYFGEPRKSKQNIETNHEILVTVGNYYTTGSKTADEQIRKDAVEMLARWYTEFITENPELHVYCAAIHCDEVGAPHLHVDFIPAAAGKEKGIGLSPSLDRALINEGISKSGGYSQLLKRWTDREKERMYEIIKDKGYEIDRGTGISRKNTPNLYWKNMSRIPISSLSRNRLWTFSLTAALMRRIFSILMRWSFQKNPKNRKSRRITISMNSTLSYKHHDLMYLAFLYVPIF